MQKGLVSIITPCYNTGAIIHRLLDSVLKQDYPCLEMYAVNDGSSDNTEDVIGSYIEKFDNKGYKLHYISQDNSGQSVAINNCLKLVKGEFLIWPDSDDYYNDGSAISKLVGAFNNNPDASVVRCYPIYVDEKTLEEISRVHDCEKHHKTDLFLDSLLCQNGFFWGAGNYMVRMADLEVTIPNRDIYTEKKAGQNWQLISPLLCKRKCLTLNEHLINILMRTSSHSRGQFSGFNQTLEKEACYERTILATIERLPVLNRSEKDSYIKSVKCKYALDNMNLCVYYKQSTKALEYAQIYNRLATPKLSKYTILICKYCNYPLLTRLFSLLRKVFG